LFSKTANKLSAKQTFFVVYWARISFKGTVSPGQSEEYRRENLKGLSYEIDFENVDENGQILALIRAAAGF
jgi:hypothetical protein